MHATDEQIIFFGKICPKAITFFSNVWSVIQSRDKDEMKQSERTQFFFGGGGGESI